MRIISSSCVLVCVAIVVIGCARNALDVAEIRSADQNIQGQVFCLAKGIVSITASRTAKEENKNKVVALIGGDVLPSRPTPIVPVAAPSGPSATPPVDKKGPSGGGEPTPKSEGGAPSGGNIKAVDDGGGITLASIGNISVQIGEVRYVPDCSHSMYSVNLDHNPLFDDDMTIEIDGTTRLLKSVNSTLTDRTPDVIKTIANAPLTILGQEKALRDRVLVSEFKVVHDIDPTDPGSVDIVNQHLENIGAKMRLYAGPLINIPHAGAETGRCKTDLCFRTAVPYVIELKTDPQENGIPYVLAQRVVVVPNKYVVASIPITRAPFVAKKFNLEFTHGMLTKVQVNNPSEVLAFVQIPIEVAKAIVSIPSAMMKFQVTQITGNNELLKAEKENLSLQKQIIEAQQSLLAAAADGTPGG